MTLSEAQLERQRAKDATRREYYNGRKDYMKSCLERYIENKIK